MFTILALKIGSEGDKILRKKLSRLTPRQFFLSKFYHPRRQLWAITENMISLDHVSYFILHSDPSHKHPVTVT